MIKTFPFLAFSKKAPVSRPARGTVHLRYDADSGNLVVLQPNGTISYVASSSGAPTAEAVPSTVVMRDASGAINALGVFAIVDSNTGFSGAISLDENLTADRVYSYPDFNATFAPDWVTTAGSPSSGGSVTSPAKVDSIMYMTPSGTLATFTWNLPAVASARVGQTCRFVSTQIITALTVQGFGGTGTLLGTALTAAAANVMYEFQCVSLSGTGVWVRI